MNSGFPMEKLSVVGGGGEGNCIIKIINNFKAARCVIGSKAVLHHYQENSLSKVTKFQDDYCTWQRPATCHYSRTSNHSLEKIWTSKKHVFGTAELSSKKTWNQNETRLKLSLLLLEANRASLISLILLLLWSLLLCAFVTQKNQHTFFLPMTIIWSKKNSEVKFGVKQESTLERQLKNESPYFLLPGYKTVRFGIYYPLAEHS